MDNKTPQTDRERLQNLINEVIKLRDETSNQASKDYLQFEIDRLQALSNGNYE
ncbi:hypothetical protein ACW6GR_000407 [Klebsiella michiganensis]